MQVMSMNSNYSGIIELELYKKGDNTVVSKKLYSGLVKVSPIIRNDRENIPTFYLLQLGGGFVEGEKYKNTFTLKKDSRAIITTQASTKVFKCTNGKTTEQHTIINLEAGSILEYITDTVILYKDSIYKQVNDIYLAEDSTFIYSDGITSGWSPEGEGFKYNKVQLKSNVYVNNKLILLDNLIINPMEHDVSKLGFFEDFLCFGTLLVINKNISSEIIEILRDELKKSMLPIDFGISQLEVNGFVLRVLGNLTQHVEKAINICNNIIREKFLCSKELIIRKL